MLDLQEHYVVSPSSPHMSLEEFERNALELFKEYFEHGDTQEVVESLEEINIRNFKPEVRNHYGAKQHVRAWKR